MTADDAIAYAHELIAHNAQVNVSYLSNAAVAEKAGVATKLLDVATQLKAYQTPPVVEDAGPLPVAPVAEEAPADAEPS